MNEKNATNIEWIDTTEALEIFRSHVLAKRRYTPNRPTLLAWLKKYDLGYKFAGRWEVDKQKFVDFLDSGIKGGKGVK